MCTGDLLDEVDATPTFGMAPEDVAQLVRRCGSRNRPVDIAVCKAEWRDGRPYPPIMVSRCIFAATSFFLGTSNFKHYQLGLAERDRLH